MKKTTTVIILILCMILGLSACGSSAKSSREEYYYANDSSKKNDYNDYNYNNPEMLEETSNKGYDATDSSIDPTLSLRKIIYTANVSINTKDFDETENLVSALIEQYKAYLSDYSSDGGYTSSNGYYRAKSSYIQIKVPVEYFEEFLAKIYELGEVTAKSRNATDVTTAYTDIEARLTALYSERDSLNALMKNAKSISDIIAIRDRLSEVNYEIESYTVQKRNYDEQIDYSSVTLRLYDVSQISFITRTFGDDFSEALRNSWVNLINFLQNTVIFIVNIFPFALLFGIVFFIIRSIYRAYRKKHPYTEQQLKKKADRKMWRNAKKGIAPITESEPQKENKTI